ncbi:hypothetical protein DVH24_006439 [Malus domestica]|uniref:Rx N-terminal domain-containing protein n=1 Tax=Malus domestica TaxID=3750 RepID=A0A498KHY7_MALDO|nr:hypothetical protein DVH24_006439 [Malus domestica]
MAAALIGEAFLSASIKVLCDGITSTEFIDLFRCKKLDESLLVKLKITLLALYAVLSDAEEKQIVNPAVRNWLDELKHAVFDAEDLLDEIDTEALRCKVEGEDQSDKLTSKVWNFFSTSHNSFYLNMNGRIKELFQRLEQLATEKDVFGLREVHGVKVSIELQQPPWLMSVVDDDKKYLLTVLLSDDASDNDVCVPAIVGIGGVGKTALAQILYNDDKVKEHFALRAWACVYEDYDAIKEQIRGKKFLFVLDDLWNVKYLDWECFRIPFTSGARRSKVIVTSRSTNVASIKQNVPIHKLKPLFNEVPDSIGHLIHLRYMDVSYTSIERLPDIVCTLYNLQTLLLSNCSSLTKLPAGIPKLINLHHLNFKGTNIGEMPSEMGRLKGLRTLTTFIVGKSTGSCIKQLRELSHLRGKLSILKLRNVLDLEDAVRANLKNKKDLKELELAWGDEDTNDSEKERHVLDKLQPSVNLEKLAISFYGGISFPNWLGNSNSLSNIQFMRLSDCSHCLSLPSFGQLPTLKVLYIERMKSVMTVGIEFYGGNGTPVIKPFQSLEKLAFKKMPEWEEWQPSSSGGQQPDFPRLQELILDNCPKLRGLPYHLPCLKKLSASECGVLQGGTATFTIDCLKQLRINECPGVLTLLDTKSLSLLQFLNIQNVVGVKCLPKKMVHSLNFLHHLGLYNCPSLESFPGVRTCHDFSFVKLLVLELKSITPLKIQTLKKLIGNWTAKCNGLPLIARALGGLLRGTISGFEEWHHILNSNTWELPSIARILPICRRAENHIKYATLLGQRDTQQSGSFLSVAFAWNFVSRLCSGFSSSRHRYALFDVLLAIAALLAYGS